MVKNVSLDTVDQKLALAKQCSHEGAVAGAKAAVVASVVTAIPTYACGKMLPWGRANLNPSAKALIVSTAAGMAYFVVADKTVLKIARQNSFKQD
ncbi:early nodulin [Datura stramonium]|uniref:Early nodulin n=1 Tax=Datura stramonium TaxID=4076 RepID=A0ABS8T8T8_DATST|nr:early nodulin [Datura stramonium]